MTHKPQPASPVGRALFAAAGLVCVGLGIVGIALPGLPTTPFLLAAAYLFARGSPRLSAWLINHRWLGRYLRAVRDDGAMPLRAKVSTLAVLWATVGLSMGLLHRAGLLGPLAVAGFVAVASAVTWFVGWRLRTVPRESRKKLEATRIDGPVPASLSSR